MDKIRNRGRLYLKTETVNNCITVSVNKNVFEVGVWLKVGGLNGNVKTWREGVRRT